MIKGFSVFVRSGYEQHAEAGWNVEHVLQYHRYGISVRGH